MEILKYIIYIYYNYFIKYIKLFTCSFTLEATISAVPWPTEAPVKDI